MYKKRRKIKQGEWDKGEKKILTNKNGTIIIVFLESCGSTRQLLE